VPYLDLALPSPEPVGAKRLVSIRAAPPQVKKRPEIAPFPDTSGMRRDFPAEVR